MLLNKNTKIRLNYLIGGLLTLVMLYFIYQQLSTRTKTINLNDAWAQRKSVVFLIIGLILLPLNLALETWKWRILAGSTGYITWREAITSYLAGLSFSFFTPNRIGEYPGRILYLQRPNTMRLVSVSILGSFAQLFAVMFFGIGGLIYFNISYPGTWQKGILGATILTCLVIVWIYLRFEKWAPVLEQFKWLRKFLTYSQLLKRFTTKDELVILGISMLRFIVFSAQYLVILHWMNVCFPVFDGFCMSVLFFWAMAAIPSVAFAEIGIRGSVSLMLFGYLSDNSIGILAATFILWTINLALPAIIGSFLMIRMRLIR